MYKEHDGVILLENLDGSRVHAHGRGKLDSIEGKPVASKGTHGAIIDLHNQAEFLLELFDIDGETIGLVDVEASEVRPATEADYVPMLRPERSA